MASLRCALCILDLSEIITCYLEYSKIQCFKASQTSAVHRYIKSCLSPDWPVLKNYKNEKRIRKIAVWQESLKAYYFRLTGSRQRKE